MTEYAPQTLRDLYAKIALKSKEMSGIVGDRAHTYGYHRGANYVGVGDYSHTLRADVVGIDGDAACALDVKLSASDMVLATNRLMVAMRNNDPRVEALREFFGTQNLKVVTGWDRHDPDNRGDDTFTASDDSHLWHIHLSFYRNRVLRSDLVLKVADVINGVPLPTPIPVTPKPYLHKAYPLTSGFFGDIDGPNESHGGANDWERSYIIAIQRRLIATKSVTGVSAAWADGRYEAPTTEAVKVFQRRNGLLVDGRVGLYTWRKLFTYV